MATAVSSATPSREDFAQMLEESFTQGSPLEGSVVKGTVVGIEKDLAVIDVGAKTEGRVALREFAGPGRQADLKVGDTVEVYLERVENALGEAVLSRDKARSQEHHRLWRLRRSRRYRRPPPCHGHRLAARQSSDRDAQYRPTGASQDHQDQS